MKYWWQRLGLMRALFGLVIINSLRIEYIFTEEREILLLFFSAYLFITGTFMFVYGDD